MKSLGLAIALFMISPITGKADIDPVIKDSLQKTVLEIKKEKAADQYIFEAIELESKVLVYNAKGEKIGEYVEGEQDPLVMRNTDLVLENNTKKIYVKF